MIHKKKLLLTDNDNPNDYKGLRFVAAVDNTQFTFNVSNKIKYMSSSGGGWKTVTANTKFPTTPLKQGEFVIICGKFGEGDSTTGNGTFNGTNNFEASGNIMSLVNHYDDPYYNEFPDTSCNKYLFYKLFSSCKKLISASNLSLPATTLADSCYSFMFSGCSNLTSAPALNAKNLANNCYYRMFEGCSNLTSAPDLPADTLAIRCYSYMFNDCSNLTSAPALNAENLANYCYSHMFEGCSSLKSARKLPATTLANYCYSYMFSGCTLLGGKPVEIPAISATTLANRCCEYMFSGCSSLISSPLPNATTLTNYCYSHMFKDCTSLTSGPDFIKINTLAEGCCEYMFSGCTKLNYEANFSGILTCTDHCYEGMFSGCTSLKTVPRFSKDMEVAEYCCSYMFSGTALTSTPTLLATTLAKGCYEGMFSNCSNLTSAPTLPATILANSCYSYMFSGCSNLTSTPTLPATILAESCYSHMFEYCIRLPSITILAKTPEIITGSQVSYANNCYVGMCKGCSSLNQVRLDDEKMWGGYYTDSNGNRQEYRGDNSNLQCTKFVGAAKDGVTDWWLEGVSENGTFKLSQNAKFGYHEEYYFEGGAGQIFGVIPPSWGWIKENV